MTSPLNRNGSSSASHSTPASIGTPAAICRVGAITHTVPLAIPTRSSIDRVLIVREKGTTIITEAHVYVPVQADAAYTIKRGFVRLHAAAGDLP